MQTQLGGGVREHGAVKDPRERCRDPGRARLRIRSRGPGRLRVVGGDEARELGPCERVERRVRSSGATRRVLCGLAGRLAAVRGWERLGYARLGDYATERLGVAPRSLQDWARFDGALRELPGLEAALVSGALGWTKVRLLARVARPADEQAWLSLAHRLSVRALAGEVRAIDLGALPGGGGEEAQPGSGGEEAQPGSGDADLEGTDEGPRTRVVVQASPEVRARWRRCHLLARRVSGDAVPMWQAMEWVAAEVLSSLPLEPRDLAGELSDAAHREEPAPRWNEPLSALIANFSTLVLELSR